MSQPLLQNVILTGPVYQVVEMRRGYAREAGRSMKEHFKFVKNIGAWWYVATPSIIVESSRCHGFATQKMHQVPVLNPRAGSQEPKARPTPHPTPPTRDLDSVASSS